MIIDCHTHLNNYQLDTVGSLPECLERLRRDMRRNRVDAALVLTSYKTTPGRPCTRAVVEATRHLKDIHVVAGICFAEFGPAAVDELRSYLADRQICGLKLYPGYEPFYPHDARLEPLYSLAEEFDVPVMIHSGDTYSSQGKLKFAHPLHVDEVAVDHPKVKLVICHLGNPWFRDTMEVVYKNRNVFTDISGLVLGDFTDRFESYMRRQLQEMLLFGLEPDKLLYGTDWPIASMESYLQFMDDLRIPEKDRRKIFYENAAALFKIPVGDEALRKGFMGWLRP